MIDDRLERVKKEIKRQKAQWKICKSSEAKYRLETLDDISDFIDSLQEEPVAEDLEDAANFYANTHIEYFDSEGNSNVSTAFKAGAQWQKGQALKNAVNAGIYEDGEDHTLHAITVPIDNVIFGERVKVVIIKGE